VWMRRSECGTRGRGVSVVALDGFNKIRLLRIRGRMHGFMLILTKLNLFNCLLSNYTDMYDNFI